MAMTHNPQHVFVASHHVLVTSIFFKEASVPSGGDKTTIYNFFVGRCPEQWCLDFLMKYHYKGIWWMP